MSVRSGDIGKRAKRKQRSAAEILHREEGVARRAQEKETKKREAGIDARRNFFAKNNRGSAHENAVADADAAVPTTALEASEIDVNPEQLATTRTEEESEADKGLDDVGVSVGINAGGAGDDGSVRIDASPPNHNALLDADGPLIHSHYFSAVLQNIHKSALDGSRVGSS